MALLLLPNTGISRQCGLLESRFCVPGCLAYCCMPCFEKRKKSRAYSALMVGLTSRVSPEVRVNEKWEAGVVTANFFENNRNPKKPAQKKKAWEYEDAQAEVGKHVPGLWGNVYLIHGPPTSLSHPVLQILNHTLMYFWATNLPSKKKITTHRRKKQKQ